MKKRSLLITLLSLILTFSVSIGLTTSMAYAEEKPVEYSMGDANLDGNVNTRDVVLIKQSIVGLIELNDKQKVFADVYADGQINTRDVVLIQQSIVGMEVDLGTHEHSFENGVCICGYVEPHTHNYSELKFDVDSHWYECSCGAYEIKENHIPGAEATETTDQKCTECNYVITPALGHVHTLHLTKVDAKPQSCIEEGNVEYYTCSCGKWFTDNTATTEITDKSSVVIEKDAHKYETLNKTATEHWWECSCGAYEIKENHKGGTATCQVKATCSVCDTVYGDFAEHDYDEVVTEPTCTEQGYTTYTCHCSDSYIDNYVEALGHTEGETVVENNVLPKCTETGSYDNVVYCLTCEDELSRETIVVDELGHTEVVDNAVAPTCTETGLTEGKHCSVCKEVLIAQEVVEATGHDYDEVVTEPTCTEQGYTTYTCHCNHSYVADYIDALGHTEIIDNAVASTCTETGLTEGKHCSLCEEVLVAQEIVEANGHDYDEVITEPTCTEQGYTTYTCHCNDSYIDNYVEALGHTEVVDNAVAPTCTETGLTEGKHCLVCNEVLVAQEIVVAKGHDYDEVITEPTCTEQGYTTYTCHCNHSYVDNYVDALGHTEVIDNAVAPTCTETGLTEGKHCSVCEEVLIVQEVVEENGHDYESAVTAPTCTAQGYTTYTCHCNHSYIDDYVDALGHTEVVDNAVASTCTETGLTEGKHCSVCEEVLIAQEEVEATGHKFTSYVYNNNATCDKDGTETASCDNGCGEIDNRTKNNSKLGFTYGEPKYVWDNNKCTATRTCVNGCEHKETETVVAVYVKDTDEMIETQETGHYVATFENPAFEMQQTEANSVTACDALGHSFTNYVYNDDAKCEVNGTETAICDRLCCNATDTREKLNSALEHNYQKTEKVIYCTLSEYQFYECLLCSKGKHDVIIHKIDSHDLPEVHNLLSVGDICEHCGGEVLAKNGDSLVIELGNIHQVEHYSGTTIGFSEYANVINFAYISNKVTEVGSSSFKNYTALTEVKVPQSVTCIAGGAFSGCSLLTSIVIPSSVTSIGSSAFSSCSVLQEITLPFVGAKAGVASRDTYQYPFGYIFGTSSYTGGTATKQYYYGSSTGTQTYGTYYIPTSLKSVTITGGNILYGAFQNCSSLTRITIPNSVTSIGGSAFSCCTSLTSITIPNSVTSIGEEAFYNCDSLTSIEIPNSVTSIGGSAFSGCRSLQEITLPFVGAKAGVTSSDTYQYPFGYIFGTSSYNGGTATEQSYYSSTSTYYIPSSLKSVTITGGNILYGAFYNCTKLTSVTIGNGVTSIGSSAFSGCSSLISIEIPDSVTNIGYRAFRDCSSLTSIEIPASVTSIGYSAFSGCDSLTSITLPFVGASLNGTSDMYFGYIFGARSDSYNEHCVPTSLKEVIITGGSSIGDYAFFYCTSLTSIEIPNSVTSIGYMAFYNCTSLTSIEIPNSVTSIGEEAFNYCDSLTSVTIGNGVTSIGDYAFYNCTSLTSIEIPNSVTSIGSSAFSSCTSLTSVTIGNGVTSIGSSAFSSCTSLTSIEIPNSVTNIGYRAFSDCSSLTSIEIPNSVKSIGDYAFDWCDSLQYNVKGGLKYLGNNENKYLYLAGVENKSITTVTIDNNCKFIGDYAFSSCTSLTSVTIGNGVTSIGEGAFYNCSKLTSLIFRDTSTWYRTTSSSDWNNKTNGTSTSVTSSSSNATYFKSTYYDYYWYKK